MSESGIPVRLSEMFNPGTQSSTARLPWWESLLWMLIAFGILFSVYRVQGIRISNNSVRYINTAEHIRSGEGVTTSILHFDEHYASGRIPAPQTVIPPLYPMLIAALMWAGFPPDAAGALISAVSFIGLTICVLVLASQICSTRHYVRLAVFLFLFQSGFWNYSTAALSEMPYTALSVFALLCAVRGAQTLSIRQILLAGLLAGASYYIRYAGFFLLVSMGATFFAVLVWKRSWPACAALLATLPGALLVGLGFLLNFLAMGSVRGGNMKVVHHPLFEILRTFFAILYHALVGMETSSADWKPPGPPEIAFAVSLVGLIVAVWLGLRQSPAFFRSIPASVSLRDVLVFSYLVLYVGGIIYLSCTTMIDFGARYIFPIVPVLCLGLVRVMDLVGFLEFSGRSARVLSAASLILFCASYATLQGRSFHRWRVDSATDVVLSRLNERVEGRQSVKEWIQQNAGPEEVLMATEGEMTAYLLRRKMLSFVPLRESNYPWTLERIQTEARKFHAKYLILYPDSPQTNEVAKDSEAVRQILAGKIPSWLSLVVKTHSVQIFRFDWGEAVSVSR